MCSETCVSLHVMCPLSDFNQTWNLSTNVWETPGIKLIEIRATVLSSVTRGRTDRHDLAGAFFFSSFRYERAGNGGQAQNKMERLLIQH